MTKPIAMTEYLGTGHPYVIEKDCNDCEFG